MKKISFIILTLPALVLSACQDKDYDVIDPILNPLDGSQVSGSLKGDDYYISWPQQSDGISVEVTRYKGSTVDATEVCTGTQYLQSTVDTNVAYTYVLKCTDGTNYSKGIILNYTRPGATAITGITMAQVDKADGYDASVTWDKSEDATSIQLQVACGDQTLSETLNGSATSYTIPNVKVGETWSVVLTAVNNAGPSLPQSSFLKIGKTMIGFLGIYDTADKCVADGDDDEASAWLWLNSQYPTAKYVSFKDIKSTDDLEQFRVLFWMRDIESGSEDEVLTMPADVVAATPYIKEWYKNGGSLLLWSHAVPFVESLGRIPEGTIKSNDHSIGCGAGSWNGDVWKMAVCLNPGSAFKCDASSHAIFKGLDVETTDRTKLIAMKGAGWTEDHNCLFFNYPAALTGDGNQTQACYNDLTNIYGIYPLATWDSQIDWVSQLNVWEATPCAGMDFLGTILCVGNGGCEFSLKNADGTPDKSAYPSNNAYQDNVLKMAKNALEYLKTK